MMTISNSNCIPYFIDTNICSYIMRDKYGLKDLVLSYPLEQIKIPSIVKGELYYGAYNNINEYDIIIDKINFFNSYEVVAFDERASEIYAYIKNSLRKKTISDNDIIIASTVLSRGGVLITNDNHFERIESLKTENWLK